MRNLFLTASLLLTLLALSVSAGGIGTAFCFGVGCPCGNDDPAAGCANSTGSGATLEAQGSTSIAADELSFHAAGLPTNKVGLLIMGTHAVNVPFKDGIRCFGGQIQRFWKHKNSGQTGTLMFDHVIWQFANIQNVQLQPGDTRNFQIWHRDTGNGSPCNQRSNLTHSVQLTFTP